MRKAVVLLVLFICVITRTAAQQVPVIRIDPGQAYGGTVSEYFSDVEYIPLETTKESLFGDIYDMIVTDSSYVISDLDTKTIFFFSLNGKLLNKIRGQIFISHDLSENRIVSFKFSEDQTKLYLTYLSLSGRKILPDVQVDLKGNSMPVPKFLTTPLGDDYFLVLNNCISDGKENRIPENCDFFSIYKNDSLYRKLIPVKENVLKATKKLSGYVSLPKITEGGDFYFSSPLDFNIYRVNKDTAVAIYRLVFPGDRVLAKNIVESDNDKFLDSIKVKVYTDRKLILNIENIFFSGSKFFFKLRVPSSVVAYNTSINEYQYNFIYDTVSKKLVSLDRLTPDKMSSFLPVMGEKSKMRGFIPFQKHLYSYMSSLVLFTAKEKTESRNPIYPTVLQEYFKTQSRKSNPVIVRMKLRE
ncbi:6-bladed beta-propeller [Niabella aquatica]